MAAPVFRNEDRPKMSVDIEVLKLKRRTGMALRMRCRSRAAAGVDAVPRSGYKTEKRKGTILRVSEPL